MCGLVALITPLLLWVSWSPEMLKGILAMGFASFLLATGFAQYACPEALDADQETLPKPGELPISGTENGPNTVGPSQNQLKHRSNFQLIFPTSYAWWVLFSCRRAHNVSSKGNRRTHPKLIQFSKKNGLETCSKNVPARFLTTVTHFWHFSNCKNLLEKPARSIFDDSYTLLALFESQKPARKTCPLDF